MRYFISYENLIKNSSLDKNVDIFDESLKLVYKTKKGKYIIKPLLVFTKNKLEIDSFIKEVEEKRKNITFMVELTNEEAKEIHPIFLKRFEGDKLLNPDEKIRLLEKDVVDDMTSKEFSNGRFINLKSIGDNLYKLSINSSNKSIRDLSIGEGEYFYTEIDRTIDKYKDKVIEIELVDRNKYKINNYKLLLIDSIGQDRLIGASREIYKYLYKVYLDSKPLYINEKDGNITINNKRDEYSKKVYILKDETIDSIIYNSNIRSLFKYINILEYKNGAYKNTSLESYIKEKKYIKKPSN